MLLLMHSREDHSDFVLCSGHWSIDRTGFKRFAVPPFDDHAAWKLYKMDFVDLQNHKNDVNFKYKNRHDTKRMEIWGAVVSESSIMIVCLFSHALWPDPQPQTSGWTGYSATQCPLVGINTQCCGKNIPWHWKGQLSKRVTLMSLAHWHHKQTVEKQ